LGMAVGLPLAVPLLKGAAPEPVQVHEIAPGVDPAPLEHRHGSILASVTCLQRGVAGACDTSMVGAPAQTCPNGCGGSDQSYPRMAGRTPRGARACHTGGGVRAHAPWLVGE